VNSESRRGTQVGLLSKKTKNPENRCPSRAAADAFLSVGKISHAAQQRPQNPTTTIMAKRKNTASNDNEPSEAALAAARDKALRAYGSRDYVTGIDIGYKYTDGKKSDVQSVRIHVVEKKDKSVLEAAEIFPTQIDGVPVDVIQAVYHPQREQVDVSLERTGRMDPIQPGISVSHPSVTAGTLGAIVFDLTDGAPCILSNWHVLVGSNAARPGDPIIQPGTADSGRAPNDTVARLERSILGPDGDAAIARLTNARSVSNAQFQTNVRVTEARLPQVGEAVEKSGRTTATTRGIVDGVGRYFITYDDRGRVGIDGFKIVATIPGNPNNDEISAGGDSGSLWYSAADKKGVGLHFAGETDPDPRQEHAIACFLPRVLSALNVTLAGRLPDTGDRLDAGPGGRGALSEIRRQLREQSRLLQQLLRQSSRLARNGGGSTRGTRQEALSGRRENGDGSVFQRLVRIIGPVGITVTRDTTWFDDLGFDEDSLDIFCRRDVSFEFGKPFNGMDAGDTVGDLETVIIRVINA
jgi:hypothetical protein